MQKYSGVNRAAFNNKTIKYANQQPKKKYHWYITFLSVLIIASILINILFLIGYFTITKAIMFNILHRVVVVIGLTCIVIVEILSLINLLILLLGKTYILLVDRQNTDAYSIVRLFPLINWQSTTSVQVVNVSAVPHPLLSLLKINRKMNLEVTITFDRNKNAVLHFTIRQKTSIFPISNKKLHRKFTSFLLSAGFYVTSPISLSKKKYSTVLTIGKKFPAISALLADIQKSTTETIDLQIDYILQYQRTVQILLQEQGVILQMDIESENSKYMYRSVGAYQTTFTISANTKEQLINYTSFISTYIHESKFQHRNRSLEFVEPEVHQLLAFPLATKEEIHNHHLTSNPQQRLQILKINPSDFVQGGMITGAIGTGKTTLKLHIMKQLLEQGTLVVDFDFKGDAAKYQELASYGQIISPKHNLRINPFHRPVNMSEKEYTDVIYRSFFETIPDADKLSPPQKNIMYQAVAQTIAKNGNSNDFFDTLLSVGQQLNKIVDVAQEQSSLALITKFNWLQTNLREIFWTEHSTLLPEKILEKSLFFDFSTIAHAVPVIYLRFIIDIITTFYIIALKDEGEHIITNEKGEKIPRIAIFIDEAQILLPNKRGHEQEFSRLEEVISTLRYKGVAVIAVGIDAKYMSDVLDGSSFTAHFRSESQYYKQDIDVSKLQNYQFLLKCESTNHESLLFQGIPFNYNQIPQEEYLFRLKQQSINSYLTPWELTYPKFQVLKLIDKYFEELPNRPLRTVIEKDVKNLCDNPNWKDTSVNTHKKLLLQCIRKLADNPHLFSAPTKQQYKPTTILLAARILQSAYRFMENQKIGVRRKFEAAAIQMFDDLVELGVSVLSELKLA